MSRDPCAQVHADHATFTADNNRYQGAVSELRPKVNALQAEIRSKERELETFFDVLPSIARRVSPWTAAADVAAAVANQVRRGRIQDEIAQLRARLRPLEQNLAAALRGAETARYHLRRTAENRERLGCGP